MDNEGNKIIAYLGYIISLIIPILGLLYGGGLFYLKKDIPLYRKHGRLTIYFAILLFIVNFIVRLMIN